MPVSGSGFPGWFIALFVIAVVAAISMAVWRFSVLRSGGLNPFVAKEQLEARLNQTLTRVPPEPGKSVEQRLAELDELCERGVISDEERSTARAKIIAGD